MAKISKKIIRQILNSMKKKDPRVMESLKTLRKSEFKGFIRRHIKKRRVNDKLYTGGSRYLTKRGKIKRKHLPYISDKVYFNIFENLYEKDRNNPWMRLVRIKMSKIKKLKKKGIITHGGWWNI